VTTWMPHVKLLQASIYSQPSISLSNSSMML